jgi:hypothetical protein
MEDNVKLIEALVDSVKSYAKVSLKLTRLKALEKISDVISTLIPHTITLTMIGLFLLFLNLGLSLWLGEILGKVYYGFLLVAGFYGVAALLVHLILQQWIKRKAGNAIVKQLLR